MDDEVKAKAKGILSLGVTQIVNNYTENALLINACSVSSKRYENITDTTGLSTIQGIPVPLRLDQEIDVQLSNKDLVGKYKGNVLDAIFRNYIVMSISIVDAVLEDMYELFLKSYELDISDSDLEKKVRCSWANDNLIAYFTNENKGRLQKPSGMKTEVSEAFMRYKEFRIIRHTLVHSSGSISEKNINTLRQYKALTPSERKGMALIDSPMISDEFKIILSLNNILSIRQYLDRFLMYLFKSVSSA